MHCSKFCLDIASDTPSSNRLIDAIASHHAPVIVSDDFELPYEDVIDYYLFCIFDPTSDAVEEEFLVNLIRSIKKDEWARMADVERVALFKIQDYGIVRGVSKDTTESQHELYRRALSLELGRHAAVVFRGTPRGKSFP
ncbi:hypothetical protein D5086_023847 [Populus alba]|uniref:Uncharacterized protein n=1 Tax=Populus alba TaxID=43335 RepID=A0ACC4BBK1_POPAL